MTKNLSRADEENAILRSLETETGLSKDDSILYLRLLREGKMPSSEMVRADRLLERGMAILSGDGKRIIPVHPRLGVANHYRTWREAMVREINEKRMKIDKLIIELIPIYEAAMEKSTGPGGD